MHNSKTNLQSVVGSVDYRKLSVHDETGCDPFIQILEVHCIFRHLRILASGRTACLDFHKSRREMHTRSHRCGGNWPVQQRDSTSTVHNYKSDCCNNVQKYRQRIPLHPSTVIRSCPTLPFLAAFPGMAMRMTLSACSACATASSLHPSSLSLSS